MRKVSNITTFLIIILLFGNACLSARVRTENVETFTSNDSAEADAFEANGEDASNTKQTEDEIRKVDFKNFTYEPVCAGVDDKAEKVRVKDGEFKEEKEMDGYTERFYFNVFDVSYGDLTGDNQAEAILLTVCNTGGTGNFSEGFVYTMKGGKPALLTRIEGGDRAYGGLREARVKDNTLIVERNDVGELGGACCPEFSITSNYKLSGNQLRLIGKESRRELYPSKRVSFARGKSSDTQTVTIPANEFQRFVISANKGQTMTVRVNSKKATVDLRSGDAETTESPGFMRAVLKEKGDYIFQVWNNGEGDAEFTVTVEIK